MYKIHICSSEYDALPIYFHQLGPPHIDALYTSYVNGYNALSPSEHAWHTRRAEIMLDDPLVEYAFCHLLQRSRCKVEPRLRRMPTQIVHIKLLIAKM